MDQSGLFGSRQAPLEDDRPRAMAVFMRDVADGLEYLQRLLDRPASLPALP